MKRGPYTRAAALALSAVGAVRPVSADDTADDEVIDDGPLTGSVQDAPTRPTGAAAVEFRGTSRITAFAEPLPGGNGDRFESRSFVIVGAKSAPSATSPWRLEIRADLLGRAKSDPVARGGQAWDLEARPWEAWYRGKVSEHASLTTGFQHVAWGVLDVGSAADVFASYDLRLGPALTPAEVRIPLPAVRLAWSLGERIDAEVAVLPFFVPHRFDVAGTRYSAVPPGTLGPLEAALDAGTLTRLTESLARVNGIDARPDRGEVGARLTWRTSHADLAVTTALARSRLPAFVTTESFRDALRTGSAVAALRVQQELADGTRPLEARHEHYVQFAIDAQGSFGSLPWGAEAGMSTTRSLLAAAPLEAPSVPRASVAQAGFRLGKLDGELSVTGQATVFALVGGPGDGTPVAVAPAIFGTGKTLALALIGARYETGRVVLEGTALGLCSSPIDGGSACANGSALISGRVGYGSDELVVSLGGTYLAQSSSATLALAQGIDQLALRLDWTPARR